MLNFLPMPLILTLGYVLFKLLAIFKPKLGIISKGLKMCSGGLMFNYPLRFLQEKSLDMLISAGKSLASLKRDASGRMLLSEVMTTSVVMAVLFILFSIGVVVTVIIYFCRKKSVKQFSFRLEDIFSELNPKRKSITIIYFGWFMLL